MNVSTSGNNPKAIVMNVRERTRGWLDPVNLHWAGVGLLSLVCLYLLVQMGLAWRLANSQNAEALAQQELQMKAAQIAARPLQGLDVKLAAANAKADEFYRERLPVSYSEIASELGTLTDRSKVRLGRVNYTQPALAQGAGKGSGNSAMAVPTPTSGSDKLTEVLLDANLTGDYRGLVEFINSLERDKVFFLVNGITLTGQQTGQVSLRIRLTTFLRGVNPGEEMAGSTDAPSLGGGAIDESIAAGKQGGAR